MRAKHRSPSDGERKPGAWPVLALAVGLMLASVPTSGSAQGTRNRGARDPGAHDQGAPDQGGRVIRHLPAGTGAGAVGLVPGGVDVEATGPAAFYADDDGKLYLLDQVNGRILGLDRAEPGRTPDAVRLPETLAPSDLVAMRNRLYVWDGRPYALEREAANGAAGQASTAAPKLEARAVSDADDVARSAFAQMGSQTPASDGEALAAAGRSLSLRELDMPVRQVLSSRTLGRVNADILPQKDGRSAIVELRPESDPLDARRIVVRVTDKLGLVEVLDVDSQGRVFVFTENVPAKADHSPAIFVARFSGKGRLDAVFDLPVTPEQLSTRRFVTISPEGKVLFLRSDASGVSIIELSSRRPRKDVLEPTKQLAATGGGTATADDPGYVTAVRAKSRAGVIQIGLAFEGLKWQVRPTNYGADPDKACVGFDGRVRRPSYLQGKVNQEVRGVPYCWGCFGSLVQFQRRIEAGALAGNWCTRENPRADTVGVDCSAFVSAAWGLQRQYTTADIPSITRRLDNPWDLRPGDALNKPGSHVMLFVQFTPDRKAEVLEASTGGCNGRVCRNIYPLSVLLARGYVPVRYPLLTD